MDFLRLSIETLELCNVWRYMLVTLHYPVHMIVIGQNPYPPSLLPRIASAFAQRNGTRDSPTTCIFSNHFKNRERATNMIRNIWTHLPSRYVFISADYMPEDFLSEGSSIDSVILSITW